MVQLVEANPLVSVVITTYNRSLYLEETLASIQNQTYAFIEILLIDDGSDPNIAENNKKIAAGFSKCTYYYKANTGQPDSRNYGITRSKGDYVGFCDDDDYWVIDKIERQMLILTLNPKYSIVTGCIEYIQENGYKSGDIKCHEGHNHGYIFESLLIKNRTASITPLLTRKVFDKVGYFNPDFRIGEDWEFWRRVSYYYEFYSINDVIAFVRLHPKNMSKSRSGESFENFKLYRKLTKSLIKWGENKFSRADEKLIYKIEWQAYRKLLSNHYPGIVKKLKFLLKVSFSNIGNGVHLFWLFLKYEIMK